ncbi:unnamed protein product [Polarella glacialis]|uniref:Aurora kinase n=1 Tax=Polarella glacialis TaxID=89957 RepID=A0A813JGE3_POLGL|nr:unnamed protein product [Polarella glacialis]
MAVRLHLDFVQVGRRSSRGSVIRAAKADMGRAASASFVVVVSYWWPILASLVIPQPLHTAFASEQQLTRLTSATEMSPDGKVEVALCTLVGDVRSQVFERIGVPEDEQRLFVAGTELAQQELLMAACQNWTQSSDSALEMMAGAKIQLVRSSSDPRNSNLGHFSSSFKLEDGLTGDFTQVCKLADAIHGEVFHYRWRRPDAAELCDVAVKKMPREKAEQNQGKDTNEWTAHLQRRNMPHSEDALAEIGVLTYLSRQPDLPLFLLRMSRSFTCNSIVWLVTEFAEGGELLASALKAGQQHGEVETRRFMWQLLTAVGYLHSHHIGHRDISLENVLLKDSSVRLMDFGMSVQSHSVVSGQELRYFRRAGKDTYRPPECYVPQEPDLHVIPPAGSGPGDVIMDSSRLCQVRLPPDALPGQPCRAELWGYAVQPVDIFSCGVCFFSLGWLVSPWQTAQLLDPFFSYKHSLGDSGMQELLKHWGKPLLAPEAMELLSQMLRSEPTARPSAAGCLASSCFAAFAGSPVPVHAEIQAPERVMVAPHKSSSCPLVGYTLDVHS